MVLIIEISGIPIDPPEPIKQKENTIKIYDKLQQTFQSVEEIPKNVNLECITCGCSTLRRPFFVPKRVMKNGLIERGDNPFCCSPNCAIYSLIKQNMNKDEYEFYYSNTIKLVTLYTGELTPVILPSPSPSILKKYGGNTDDIDYQLQIFALGSDIIKKLYVDKIDMIRETQEY